MRPRAVAPPRLSGRKEQIKEWVTLWHSLKEEDQRYIRKAYYRAYAELVNLNENALARRNKAPMSGIIKTMIPKKAITKPAIFFFVRNSSSRKICDNNRVDIGIVAINMPANELSISICPYEIRRKGATIPTILMKA